MYKNVYPLSFFQAQKQRCLENVMFNMAAIELNDQMEPIDIVNTFGAINIVHRRAN